MLFANILGNNVASDVSSTLDEITSIHLFIGREQIESQQAGSQTFTVVDW